MPTERDRHLDPADADDKREDERMEELREESRSHTESFVHDNIEIATEISIHIATLESESFHSDALESSQRAYSEVSFTSETDQEDENLRKIVKEVIAELGKKSPPKDKQSNTRRYLAFFFGITGITAAVYLVYELCARNAKNEPTDDISISQEDKNTIEALFKKWQDQSDEDFWETVAQYQETEPTPTLADQIYFCQYTKQLSPSPDLWIWDKGADEMAIVESLEKLYRDSSPQSTAVLYRNITKQSYQGKLLPRDVAADVLTLTLTQILKAQPS